MPNAILPQDFIKSLFDYDPETGALTWRNRPLDHFKNRHAFNIWNARYAGKTAGCLRKDGYLIVSINNNRFYAHRLIYKIIHGTDPDQIDHINGIRDDNMPNNLRAATHLINSKNMKLPSTNKSGVIGVYWNKPAGKWAAQIKVGGKGMHLGLFDDIKDAAESRRAAEIKYGFHPNHGKVRL